MSSRAIITDWVMVPLVLVVLIGGFAMNIKAVESKNSDLSKKLDEVQAQLAELKQGQKHMVARTAPAKTKAAVESDKAKPDAAKTPAPDKPKNDDDEPANSPL